MYIKTNDLHWQAQALVTLRFDFASGRTISYGNNKASLTGTRDHHVNDSALLAGILFFTTTITYHWQAQEIVNFTGRFK